MFATLRKKMNKWGSSASPERTDSNIVRLFAGLLEEVLFWKTMWLSISFIAMMHIILMVCVQRQISLFQFVICFSITMQIMDSFESWLKYKHRTTLLKKISNIESVKLNSTLISIKQWLRRQWINFIFVRETNHAKAFLLVNIVLGIVFVIGKYINGYLLVYMICMLVCFSYKLVPPVMKLFRRVLTEIESDSELEGLIPEASEIDIKLLSIEPEKNSLNDDRQSLDYWKPDDVLIEDVSDSSENSNSIITNFSMEKVQTLQKDIDTSDSSEDEYIPLDRQHKDQLQSTLEVAEPSSWSSSAYNTLWNFTGAVVGMVQADKDTKRKRISSVDSSDGFEMIDKNEFN